MKDLVKKTIFAAIAVFIAIVLTLAVLEVVFRVRAVVAKDDYGFRDECVAAAPGVGYRYKADCRLKEFYINGEGFRGKELPKEKDKETFRIACLGDSYTASTTAGEHDAYPAALERYLRSNGMPQAETMNMGVFGYDTTQEAEFYHRFGKQYHPDLVVLGIYLGNDINDNIRDYRYDVYDGQLVTWPLDKNKYWKKRIALSSYFYRWYKSRRKKKITAGGVVAEKRIGGFTEGYLNYQRDVALGVFSKSADATPYWQERWNKTFSAIEGLRREAEENGARLLVVVMPPEVQVNRRFFDTAVKQFGLDASDYDFTLPGRKIIGFCRGARLDCIDLYPVLLAAQKRAPQYAPDTGHWNAAGNRLAADAIGRYIRGTIVP